MVQKSQGQAPKMYQNPANSGLSTTNLNWSLPDFWLPSTVWRPIWVQTVSFGVPRCSPGDLAAERHGNVESLWGSVAARGAGVMGVCGNCQRSFSLVGNIDVYIYDICICNYVYNI